ncbi:unnamed protein product [Lampetra fluviatilis]
MNPLGGGASELGRGGNAPWGRGIRAGAWRQWPLGAGHQSGGVAAMPLGGGASEPGRGGNGLWGRGIRAGAWRQCPGALGGVASEPGRGGIGPWGRGISAGAWRQWPLGAWRQWPLGAGHQSRGVASVALGGGASERGRGVSAHVAVAAAHFVHKPHRERETWSAWRRLNSGADPEAIAKSPPPLGQSEGDFRAAESCSSSNT